jgi:hypothetical protein
MPDRLLPRAALASLLVLLTIAGLRAAGPAVDLHRPPDQVVLVTGAGLEAMLAVLLTALRRGAPPPAGAGARLRPMLSGALVIGLIAVPIAVAITFTRKLPRSRPHRPALLHPNTPRIRLPHAGRAVADTAGFAVGRYVLVGLLVAAIIIAAILIWRRRRAWVRLHAHGEPAGEDTGTPAELARAVDSGRLALRELDDARAAIIGCYLAMEQSLADAGAARGAAETPDELLARAVAGDLVSGAPATRLTALFYEARFSTHPMAAARRDEAEHALAALAATLPEPARTADPNEPGR